MDILTKPKIQILNNHPFYASFLMKMRTVLTHEVKKAVSDGKTIRINPEYFESLTPGQQLTLLAKPTNHVMLMHNLRRGSRNTKKWSEACSYCVNALLAQDGFDLPDDALFDPQYIGMSAEKVYQLREQQQQDQENNSQGQPGLMPQSQDQDNGSQGQGDSQNDNPNSGDNGQGQPDPDSQQNNDQEPQDQNGDGNQDQSQQPQTEPQWQPGDGFGDIEDFPGDEQEQREQEQEIKETLVAASHAAKQAGKLPAGMERLIDELLAPVLDWKTLLRQFTIQCKNDYSFRYPNRRHIQRGMYLPSVYSEDVGNFAIIVDTSGSISYEELKELASEVKDIAEVSNSDTTVLYVDSRLAGVETFAPGEEIDLHPKGGGGTDFRPGFKYIRKQGMSPACVIYFTDGYCNDFPKKAPDYPVLWVIKDNPDFEPPFGTKIDF